MKTAIAELRAAALAHRLAADRAELIVEFTGARPLAPWDIIALRARADALDDIASKLIEP